MKATFLPAIGCFVATFIFVSSLVAWLLGVLGLEQQNLVHVRIEHALKAGKIDVLFLGPSTTELSLNPVVFDAVAGEHGHFLRSCNMGIDGLSVPEITDVVRRLDAANVCCIKYIVLSVLFQVAHVSQNPESPRLFR
jgi:hypothetical protein